jgi:DNA-binding transcriptional LysR family regulator
VKKFDDLLVFVAVAEKQSFVAAARQLGLPATTVSRKVQELEARLGVQLLRRTTRRVSTTETGRAVYEQAARGFLAIEEAESLARRRHDKPAGVLRVAMPNAVADLSISAMIPEFRAAYPEVRVELLIANVPLDLIDYGCDCAIRVGPQPDSSYVSRPLIRAGYKLIATPAFLDRVGRPRTLEDLASLPMALLSDFGKLGLAQSILPDPYEFAQGARRRAMRFLPALVSNEPAALMAFIERHAGCTIMLEALCREKLADGRLEEVLPAWTIDADLELSIVYARRATAESKVRVFIDFLLARVRDLPAGPMRTSQ